MAKSGDGKGKKGSKIGRNKVKCARYRTRIGKPHALGNKSGKNKR